MARWTVQELQKSDWFNPLREQIQRALEVLSAERHAALPALAGERDQLRQQMQGWSQSLAKPDLSLAVRGMIEKDMEAAVGRMQAIEQQLAEADALRRQAETIVDPQQAVERLNRLADVLTAQNPSRANLELSLHLDAIRCYDDGRVVVKICKLGALIGSKELLARPQAVRRKKCRAIPKQCLRGHDAGPCVVCRRTTVARQSFMQWPMRQPMLTASLV